MSSRQGKKQRPTVKAATPETVATEVSASLKPLLEETAGYLLRNGMEQGARARMVQAVSQALVNLMAENAPPIPARPAPRHQLRKELRCWRLVFEGRESVMTHSRGLELAAYLLKNPAAGPIHAVELEARVSGHDPRATGPAGVVDREAVLQEASGASLEGGSNTLLLRQLKKLMAMKDDETLPESERRSAREEIEELLRASERGGKLATAAAKAAERVGKALKRLRENLAGAELQPGQPNGVLRAFGEHLQHYLLVPSLRYATAKARTPGVRAHGCFTYERPSQVIWTD